LFGKNPRHFLSGIGHGPAEQRDEGGAERAAFGE
jgi:hypothetical protein